MTYGLAKYEKEIVQDLAAPLQSREAQGICSLAVGSDPASVAIPGDHDPF